MSENLLTHRNSALFAGLTTVDFQYLFDKYPLANTKNAAKQFGIYVGGPATNAAIAYSYLSGSADLVSSVGNNALTGLIHYELKQYSIHHFDLSPLS